MHIQYGVTRKETVPGSRDEHDTVVNVRIAGVYACNRKSEYVKIADEVTHPSRWDYESGASLAASDELEDYKAWAVQAKSGMIDLSPAASNGGRIQCVPLPTTRMLTTVTYAAEALYNMPAGTVLDVDVSVLRGPRTVSLIGHTNQLFEVETETRRERLSIGGEYIQDGPPISGHSMAKLPVNIPEWVASDLLHVDIRQLPEDWHAPLMVTVGKRGKLIFEAK